MLLLWRAAKRSRAGHCSLGDSVRSADSLIRSIRRCVSGLRTGSSVARIGVGVLFASRTACSRFARCAAEVCPGGGQLRVVRGARADKSVRGVTQFDCGSMFPS